MTAILNKPNSKPIRLAGEKSVRECLYTIAKAYGLDAATLSNGSKCKIGLGTPMTETYKQSQFGTGSGASG